MSASTSPPRSHRDPDHRGIGRGPPDRRRPAASSTRPTSDRVREALFSAVESWCGSLHGLRFLDLYAGSGAVGLEAWSRGAGVVTLVEQDRRTAALISANARDARLRQGQRRGRRRWPATLRRPPAAPYDVVFLDPPYPLAGRGGRRRPRRAGRPRLAGAGRAGGRRALLAQPRARPGPTGFTDDPGEAVRRDRRFGTVTPRPGRPPSPPPARSDPCAEPSAPGPSTRSPTGTSTSSRGPRSSSTRWWSRSGVNKSKNRLFSRRGADRDARARRAPASTTSRVDGFTGLLTTFCAERDIHAIVKGLRAVSDFDYELQMAQMNASLADVETVFVPTSPEYSFLASSLVKEVATFGGDVSGLVPGFVHERAGRAARRSAEQPASRLSPGCAFAVPVPRPVTILDDLSVPGPGSDPLSNLDPRAPLVLDTRELGRRPGSQREVSRTVPAPADLGIEVLRVPEGSPVELDLRLEAVMEGVLVTGTARPGSRASACGAWSRSPTRSRCGSRSCSSTTTSDARPRRGRRGQHARGRPARPRAAAAGRGGARTAVPAAVRGRLSRTVRRVWCAAGGRPGPRARGSRSTRGGRG